MCRQIGNHLHGRRTTPSSKNCLRGGDEVGLHGLGVSNKDIFDIRTDHLFVVVPREGEEQLLVKMGIRLDCILLLYNQTQMGSLQIGLNGGSGWRTIHDIALFLL